MSAAGDSVHTVRRVLKGLGHLIKLDQPEGVACWDLIDAYGSCGELLGYGGLLTDEQVDKLDAPVVYVPEEDSVWQAKHDPG